MDPFDYDDRWHDEQRQEAEASKWFHDLYYDPVAEAAAGIKRAYRWQPQDPISPYEVLQAQFARKLSQSTIEDLSNELSQQSSNWRARPDEFEHPYAEESTTQRVASVREVNMSRAELLQALADLDNAVGSIRRPPPSFGHNMPPEGIDDDVGAKRELDDLVAAVAELREQANSDRPNSDSVAESQTRLLTFAKTVMSWTGARGTKFVDSVLDSGGKALGTTLVLQVTGILPQVFAAVAAAGRFVAALAH